MESIYLLETEIRRPGHSSLFRNSGKNHICFKSAIVNKKLVLYSYLTMFGLIRVKGFVYFISM